MTNKRGRREDRRGREEEELAGYQSNKRRSSRVGSEILEAKLFVSK